MQHTLTKMEITEKAEKKASSTIIFGTFPAKDSLSWYHKHNRWSFKNQKPKLDSKEDRGIWNTYNRERTTID